MKKVILCVMCIVCVSLIGIGIFRLTKDNEVQISEMESGRVIFNYADDSIQSKIDFEDIISIEKIFIGKKLYKDIPSCGFDEKIAIEINDTEIFCIACDGCPVVYYQNTGRYFNISETDNKILKDILYKYGCYFPCL